MNTEDTRALDRVLAALTTPAHPDELKGRDRALAAFREAAAAPSPAVPEKPARRRLPTGRLPVRVGIAALCATLLGGGVAVAAGAGLPLPGIGGETRSAAPEKPRLMPKKAPSAAPPAAPAAQATPSASPSPALDALCRRILREKEGRRSRPEPAITRDAAYAALVRAAGGADRVRDHCRALLSRDSRPSRPSRPSDRPWRGDREDGKDRPDRSTARPDRPGDKPDRTDRPRPRKSSRR